MTRPPVEVGEVFRRHGEAFLASSGSSLSLQQRRVLGAVAECRTSALGGHVDACDRCDHLAISYNSCRNRHCPKCQKANSAAWLQARAADLLEIPYFHVVFTLPDELAPLALQNKKVLYDLLFAAASRTLLEIAADPKHLGARIGFLGILHTWGQTLNHHPHVHFVVPGGGLSPDGSRWVPCRQTFFLPVRVLSAVFRGKFLEDLRRAFRDGRLAFHGRLAGLAHPSAFEALIARSCRNPWVVYAKPPFGSPRQVLKYLARYTHKVAIANQRLVSLDEGRVRFRWKDYADGQREKVMSLDASEFLRRFLLHVLPQGFVRIRYFGLLANHQRRANLALARRLLGTPQPPALGPTSEPIAAEASGQTLADQRDDATAPRCPVCREGRMLRVRDLAPFEPFPPVDTSVSPRAFMDSS